MNSRAGPAPFSSTLLRRISPIALAWIAIGAAVCLSASMLWIEERQNDLVGHYTRVEGLLRQARVDLANGILHVSLSTSPQMPFVLAEGLSLLDQSTAGLENALRLHDAFVGKSPAGNDTLAHARLTDFRESVRRCREVFGRASGQAESAAQRQAALRIAIFNMEREAAAAKSQLETDLDAVMLRYDRYQRMIIWGSGIFLSIICGAVYAASRSHKGAVTALRESEERYRNLLDVAPVGIAVHSEGKIVFSNPAGQRLLGASSPEQLVGKTIAAIVHPDRYAAAAERIQRMLSGEGGLYPTEDVYVRLDGSTVDVEVMASPLAYNGKPAVQVIVTDITERKLAQDALLKHSERLRSLHSIDQAILQAIATPEAIVQSALQHLHGMLRFDRAGAGIMGLDNKTLRVFAVSGDGISSYEITNTIDNDAESDIAILRRVGTEIVGDASRSAWQPDASRLLRVEGMRSSITMPLRSARGLYGALQIGWEEARVIPHEETEIVAEVARHVTIAIEQARLLQETRRHSEELGARVKERTAELEAANRELEAFTYSVSHDLRAPLRAVDGFTRVLLDDYGSMLDAEGQRVCAIISKSARNMGRLIDDLLAFSRVGRAAMQSSLVDMAKLAHGVYLEAAGPEARERIDFSIGSLPSVAGDPGLLRQVWVNLLSNALKFSSKMERARIDISAAESDDVVVYSVQDNGAGFDMSYVGKLFGVFQRLHSAKEFEGTGVGLAIAQRIIHRHGGCVWAVGETGKGATFSFSIPTGQTPWTASTS
jgi:PAS domain S-box-containing protein